MDASHPFATHVAVNNGKIVGLGDKEIVSLFPDFKVITEFKNKTILPGFVEGHAHAMAGQDGLAPYVGYFDRPSPEGKTLKGIKSMKEIIEYLSSIEKKMAPGVPLVAMGFDPIYFDGLTVDRHTLDKISTTRSVYLLHVSGHLATVNTKGIEALPQEALKSTPGVTKDNEGHPTGEMREVKALGLVFAALGKVFLGLTNSDIIFPRYIELARKAGVTTITEMGVDVYLDDPKEINKLIKLTQKSPVRIVPMYFVPTSTKKPEQIPSYVKSLEKFNTEKLRFGLVKLMADGSIQGYSARVKKPYINGVKNGIWNQDPKTLKKFAKLFHKANITMHCHCNGDEASEAFIKAVAEAEKEKSWKDARHTMQHTQMADEKQYAKMKKLNMCANIFTNHIYYWGDQHVAKTIGKERAMKMNAANTALSLGVPFSMHCDASVTPINPLFNIWTAVNRVTASGKVLGPDERISVADALYAMTLGSAYLLRLEKEIGSITIGKMADFVVLDKDPYTVDPMEIKDIGVVTTISSGEITSA